MNVMTTNKTTVESIAFASLSLSDLNPRTVVNDDSIVALAANIATVGLIQNLAGYRPDNGNVEIVAGGRRLRQSSDTKLLSLSWCGTVITCKPSKQMAHQCCKRTSKSFAPARGKICSTPRINARKCLSTDWKSL